MQKVINFLPHDYMERRSRRHANIVCLVIGGGAVLVMGALVGFTFLRTFSIKAMRAVVEQQYQEAAKQIETLTTLEERKEGLLRKVELSANLLERVPRSHVLARLTNLLPPNTSIQVLTMATDQREVPVKPDPATDSARDKTKAKQAPRKGPPPTVLVTEVQFKLHGLAETDVQVAEYIGRLSADPFFEELNLKFSEAFAFKEGVPLRRFEIVFLLSEEAEKLLEKMPETGTPRLVPSAGLKTGGDS